MGKLLNQKSGIKLLKSKGWTKTAGGKHNVKMACDGKRPITLPHHKGEDYGKGLTAAILKQADLSQDDL